jgi:ABC-2 type transport system ATP-binding protein
MRRLAAATAVALPAAILPTGPARAQQSEAFTTEQVTVEVTDGPNDDQTVTIDAKVLIPEGVDGDNPAPVIISAHGFGGTENSEDAYNTSYAEAGYVVFAYSARGFGNTTGKIGLQSIDYDVKDVRQLIDFLAQRPEVALDGENDPVLGMSGPSYGGGIQLQVAGADDRVDAITPRITWNTLVYSLSPNNHFDAGSDAGRLALQENSIDPIGVFKQQWTSAFFGLGQGEVNDPCSFVSPVCQRFAETTAAGRGNEATADLLKKSSPATQPRLRNIEAATFLLQGQSDTLFNLNEAIVNYTAIASNDAPVKMLWHDGGHSDTGVHTREFLENRILSWFDKHLRGAEVETGPQFEFYRNWVEGKEVERFGGADSYPPTGDRRYFLSNTGPSAPDSGPGCPPNGTLVSSAESATAGQSTFLADPSEPQSYSETSAVPHSSQPPASDVPGKCVAYETEPLAETTTVVGVPTAKLPLSSSADGQAQLYPKVYDVAPDGSTKLIRRLVAPTRSTDLSTPVDARLAGIAHEFGRGHRIRFAVASTDQAYAFGNQRTPTTYTLSVGGEDATFTVPVLPDDRARRIFGSERSRTAVSLSAEGFETATAVVLAREDEFPDALASASLASEIGGPVLLTQTDELRDVVRHELDRLGVEKVYLAGGLQALSDGVAQAVRELGYEVERLAGENRFDTANLIAREVVGLGGQVNQAVVARADEFADALAAGNLSVAARTPILLTTTDDVPQVTLDALDDTVSGDTVFVAGGEQAVSASARSELTDSGYQAPRRAGDSRYGTAIALVEQARQQDATLAPTYIASGEQSPDALAAAPVAGTLGGVLQLVPPETLPEGVATTQWLSDNRGAIDELFVAGGPHAVADSVVDRVESLIRDR